MLPAVSVLIKEKQAHRDTHLTTATSLLASSVPITFISAREAFYELPNFPCSVSMSPSAAGEGEWVTGAKCGSHVSLRIVRYALDSSQATT